MILSSEDERTTGRAKKKVSIEQHVVYRVDNWMMQARQNSSMRRLGFSLTLVCTHIPDLNARMTSVQRKSSLTGSPWKPNKSLEKKRLQMVQELNVAVVLVKSSLYVLDFEAGSWAHPISPTCFNAPRVTSSVGNVRLVTLRPSSVINAL